jgi:hypothetical protein
MRSKGIGIGCECLHVEPIQVMGCVRYCLYRYVPVRIYVLVQVPFDVCTQYGAYTCSSTYFEIDTCR